MHQISRWIISSLVLVVLLMTTGCIKNDYVRQKGLNAHRLEQYDVARDKFQRCVDMDPADWKAHYYLGLIDLRDSVPIDAGRHLEIAFALIQDIPAHRSLVTDALAQAIYDQGQLPQLFNYLKEMIDRYGDLADYIRYARYLEITGDHDSALIAYRTAIRIAPSNDPTPYIAIADFFESIGACDNAVIELRRAYSITPKDPKLCDRIRSYGIVPGPTIALPPQQQ